MKTISQMSIVYILLVSANAFGWDFNSNDPRSNGNGDWASSAYSEGNPRSSTDQAFNNANSWTSAQKERYYRETTSKSISTTYSRGGEGRGVRGVDASGGYYDYSRTRAESIYRDLYPALKSEPSPPPSASYTYSIPGNVLNDEYELRNWFMTEFPPYPEAAPPQTNHYYGDFIKDDELNKYSEKVDQYKNNEAMPSLTVTEKLWGFISVVRPSNFYIDRIGSAKSLGLIDFTKYEEIENPLVETFVSIVEKTESKRPAVVVNGPVDVEGDTKTVASMHTIGYSLWGDPEYGLTTRHGRRDVPNELAFPVEVYNKNRMSDPVSLQEGFHASLDIVEGEILRDNFTSTKYRYEMGTVVSDAMRAGARQAGLALDVVENFVPDKLLEAIDAIDEADRVSVDDINYVTDGEEVVANVLSGHAIDALVTAGMMNRLTDQDREDFAEDAQRIRDVITRATTEKGFLGIGWFNEELLSDEQINDILDEVAESEELLNSLKVINEYLR